MMNRTANNNSSGGNHHPAGVITVLLILGFASLASAQAPENWSVNPSEYEYFMTVTGVLEINGSYSQDSLNVVAAFVSTDIEEECRGVITPARYGDRWIYFLMIYSNTNGEDVYFRYYHAAEDSVLGITDVIGFTSGGGGEWSPDQPFVFHGIAINEPPVALSQDIATNEDVPVAIELTGEDINIGDTLTFDLTMAPLHGELSGETPELLYTPAPDFFGEDSFGFRVYDGEYYSEPAVITIGIYAVNDPPGAFDLTAPPDNYVLEDSNLIRFQWTSSTDIEGDSVSYGFHLNSTGYDTVVPTADNHLMVDVQEYNLPVEQNIYWYVLAWDSTDTTESSETWSFLISPPVSSEPAPEAPLRFSIAQNYPNPFNASTVIPFRLPGECYTSIDIFDLSGRKVLNLVSDVYGPGYHNARWDARNSEGFNIPSGVYIYRITASGNSATFRDTGKLILMR